MRIVYDIIFLAISLLYLPVYAFRKKFHAGFAARLGILPNGLRLNNPIWVHAVSVGEAVMIRGLLEELRLAYPGKKFVISTVTPTGNSIAQKMARAGDLVTYLPLDFSFIVRSVIARIKPSLFIIAETELWPNLISSLRKNNIPIIVVNGRVSDSSFGGYNAIRFFLSPVLNKVNVFSVQTERDKERLALLGVALDKIQVAGNMKFDIRAEPLGDVSLYRQALGLASGGRLVVAGSTHPQEEAIILAAYKELVLEHPDTRLLIAPRHPERAFEVAGEVEKFGLQPKRVSQADDVPIHNDRRPVFILDTVGQLISYYAIADIVFVGGSLVKRGGHNILEPAAFGKPVIFGPHMFNFRDIARLFLEAKAAVLVHGKEDLLVAIKNLLNSPSEAAALGMRAQKLIARNQGATRKNLQIIKNLL